MISTSARSASSGVEQTATPLPAARPSALTTHPPPSSRTWLAAPLRDPKTRGKAAVGIPWRAMKRFAKDLLDSSWAANADGPKAGMPASRNRSARPAASGPSGPITTRPILSASASWISASKSVALQFPGSSSRTQQSHRFPVPPAPRRPSGSCRSSTPVRVPDHLRQPPELASRLRFSMGAALALSVGDGCSVHSQCRRWMQR